MLELGDLHSEEGMTDQEVITGIATIVDAENRLAAHKYGLLAQFSRRGLSLALKHSSPTHWLAAGTRVAHGNAHRQFNTAGWLTTRPTIVDALATGDIHNGHVKEIYDGTQHITDSVPTLTNNQVADAVAELLTVALVGTQHEVRTRAQELAHHHAEQARSRYEEARREQVAREQAQHDAQADGGGTDNAGRDGVGGAGEGCGGAGAGEAGGGCGGAGAGGAACSGAGTGCGGAGGGAKCGTAEAGGAGAEGVGDPEPLLRPPPVPVSENSALNTLEMYLQANGRTVVRGDLDKVAAEKLRAAIAEHSRPEPGPGGTRDTRSAPRRNADALSHVLDRYRGQASNSGTSRVNVTVHLRDLIDDGADQETNAGPKIATADHDWPFHLTWTGPISRSLARMLACDADLNPIILDDNGIPLAMGYTERLATPEQRTALVIRDRCCIKCGTPAHYCRVHHIVFWGDGGPTDLNNLTLVCSDCHHDIHHRGWKVAIGADGHPYITPPTAVDPDRRPIPSYHRRRKPAA